MSNYINVLRRLERERRAPDGTPMSPAPATDAVRPEIPPAPPIVEARVAPVATPITPQPVASQPASAPPVMPMPVAERTVIPLPSVTPTSPLAPPVVAVASEATMVAPPVAPAPSVRPTLPRTATRPVEHAVDTRRARAFATETHPGIATLLDAIRLISNGRERRVVVLCGASNAEAVASLADALVTHAERTGMRAFLATLNRTTTGSAIVPALGATMDVVLPLDLDAGTSVEALGAWADQVEPATDLVVITGPPLASSIDAALLACASDGLVIVAESEVTERAALQLAAERARIAGCKTLGVVMHGSKERLPRWLHRLMGGRTESHIS